MSTWAARRKSDRARAPKAHNGELFAQWQRSDEARAIYQRHGQEISAAFHEWLTEASRRSQTPPTSGKS